ncbi:carboxylesterase/lipase family protein [Kribbella sp. VKM Ac-2566]|uniref:carboxylesterase/lipase family protein n=1 Tax=Kribbella sp. VKM Ac-2566 TaxID=2512218 RepID=UPI0010626AA7|nr:carboxylesterase family protein [Kribbella sp. VKM Ac-2566]TDW92337.1 para-nitrobenzyl esterase [Kribbella sp. VKM Ac-2566]
MRTIRPRLLLTAAATVAATAAAAVTLGSGSLPAANATTTATTTASIAGHDPVVATGNGAVRGVSVDGTYSFRGVPFAAAPTGSLRWRPPQPAASWQGVRDATSYGPGCPQAPSVVTPAQLSEDCLYLNVSTPAQHSLTKRPVLVWIHGGGLVGDAGSNYDGTKLTKAGAVVVTINYRLGALGFLVHPALAASPGGPAGNYGLMDQQAALRWVQRNIGQFGGDPHNVTIAGESAGGLSVLAHVTSRSSKDLFQRAIVESGAFALEQEPPAKAETFGEEFATKVGCPDQSADCLRKVPVQTLVDNISTATALIPGVVDGAVLKESIGTALAAGRFNHVTILNGSNHDEEALFTLGGRVVSRGYNVPYTSPVTAANYESNIATALRITPAQAAAIAADYPLSAYSSPDKAFGTLIGDATFACGAAQVNKWTARHVPTYGYEFDDDTSPFIFAPPGFLSVATHGSEMWYLFDLPNAPFPAALNAEQTALADSMRAAWVKFAATGNPSTPAVRWPSSGHNGTVLSLELPGSQVSTDFAARHHCATFAQNLDKVK